MRHVSRLGGGWSGRPDPGRFTIQQLRVVVRIHSELVRVDLFRLEPLYAFSSLTSRTGITLIAMLLYGVGSLTILNGGYTLSAVDFTMLAAFLVLSVACFVVPLMGLHGRINAVKERRLAEANASLETVLAEVHARIGAGDFEHAAAATGALTAATAALAAVKQVSPWPWRPETFRAFASAVILPVAVWLITGALGRLIGS